LYLKSLEIQGFKSFPDKTTLNFGADVTAVVGPNGSGKSNISDAICWVMGEQSTKNLRGAKMEDVIFSGTAKRPAMGFAQVTLILDNTDRMFPSIEGPEAAVTRRYYRSGESEYYINRKSVRLRDVMELLMDTGMGREGYSIIGQGKIDEIISTRSGDRREVFEEAAGISRFRHRKEESERELGRTRENLLRINDKIAELELQLAPLREQAETAKKYLILRDELRTLEISVWLTELDNLRTEARKLQASFRGAQTARDEARASLDRLYAEGEQYSERMREKDVEAERLRSEASALEGRISQEDSAAAVLETTTAHSRENLERAAREFSEQNSRTEEIQKQIAGQKARTEEIDKKLETLRMELDGLLQQTREAEETADRMRAEVEALRKREGEAKTAAAEIRAKQSAVQAESRQLEERKNAVLRDQSQMAKQLAANELEAETSSRALKRAQEEAAGHMVGSCRQRTEEQKESAAAAAEKHLELTMAVGALDNRIRLLRDMEREYEGFSRAVRMVMQANGSLRGIHGPVGNLIHTDRQYVPAMEIALGGGMQDIVVDREEDAKAAIGYLKRRDGGRATFLPMTTIRGEEMDAGRLQAEPGYIGIASALISFDPQYRSVMQYLLGRTVIIRDLDSGIAITKKYGSRFRMVTLDGQVINRGGSMTGGSLNRNSGVLSRGAELEKLDKQAGALHDQLAESAKEKASMDRGLQEARQELEVAEGRQREAENEVLRLEGQNSHFEILIRSQRENLENLNRELAQLEGRLQENARHARTAASELEAREKEAEDLRVRAEELLSGQAHLTAQSGGLSGDITARSSAIAALTAEKDTMIAGLRELERLSGQIRGDRAVRERQTEEYRRSIESAQTEMIRHREAAEKWKMELQTCRNKLTALNDERLALEAERTARNRAGQEMNENLLNLERSASGLEQKISAAAMEEKQILDRLWERYELSHTDAQAQRIELESLPRTNRRIGELRRDLSALGAPNLGAIEEFDRVNTRYTYLTGQRDDVEQAGKELEGVIREITEQMTQIFKEQFQLLSDSFQSTFTDLFGGGQARLELEDEDDILNCGIEIKAQPPGKTLKTISLLSGGEKAFVAIALYFAILKVHPTPFCVMDEIEAALDDVNVTHFARYMRTLADRTQFIVITHRRGTMEEADVLYGITMQEQGVSKILTIDLNHMERELIGKSTPTP
jgi:chromosome segregation protein